MKLLRLTILLCLAAPLPGATALAQTLPPQKDEVRPEELDHKLVDLKKKKLALADFTYETLEGQKINLREVAKGKKAVLIVYFAAWCDNSAHDSATVNALYRAFHDKGLAVIGVSNYSSRNELKGFITKNKIEYPVCLESEAKTEAEISAKRETTTHFKYRRQAGDERKWGTPFAVLIETKEIKSEGDIAAETLHTANGELRQDNAEKLIRKQLDIR